MTRVLWLTKGLGRGGAERLITSCVPHLAARGLDVEVAYVLPEKDAYVPRLVDAGITVHALWKHTSPSGWSGALRRLIEERDYAIVHTHSPFPGAIARVAAGRAAARFVHTEHNMWERYRRGTYWANALTYRRNDAVIAVSQAVAESIPPRFCSAGLRARGVDVVLHGIDLDKVTLGLDAKRAARKMLGVPEDALVVGTVGNLTEKKNHPMLVEAFRQVQERHPGARLVVIGSGPLEQQLRENVQRARLTDLTVLAGSRDDASELVIGFDAFALSSRFEGLSIALVEALAVGVPTVATRVGGVPEVLDGSSAGIMVSSGDATAFAGALDRLFSDPELRSRMAQAAITRAADFSIDNAVGEIVRIYDEILVA